MLGSMYTYLAVGVSPTITWVIMCVSHVQKAASLKTRNIVTAQKEDTGLKVIVLNVQRTATVKGMHWSVLPAQQEVPPHQDLARVHVMLGDTMHPMNTVLSVQPIHTVVLLVLHGVEIVLMVPLH